MALKFFLATETDPGEWFVWQDAAGEKLEVKVRRLPPAESQRIDNKHFGRTRQITHTSLGAQQKLDLEAQGKANREKAAYCMVETRGFRWEAGTEKTAEALSGLLGEKVALGQVVSFDGHWIDALKEITFAARPDLVDWIGEQAKLLSGHDTKEEQEALGN